MMNQKGTGNTRCIAMRAERGTQGSLGAGLHTIEGDIMVEWEHNKGENTHFVKIGLKRDLYQSTQ